MLYVMNKVDKVKKNDFCVPGLPFYLPILLVLTTKKSKCSELPDLNNARIAC